MRIRVATVKDRSSFGFVGQSTDLLRQLEVCTLPTVERPLRIAEFSDLFATAAGDVRRVSPTEAVVMMPGGMLAMARSLAARETNCCSFFEFKVEAVRDRTIMAIRVPERYTDVLSALTGLAAEKDYPVG